MHKVTVLLQRLRDDEQGASLVEYTVLLGVMLVAAVSTIAMVGNWVNAKWVALWTALSATGH